MLNASRQRGFNLIELMVVVLIVSILVVIGLPDISEWLQNSRTRSVAESVQNGIRFAEAEAARLSRQTKFISTSSGWSVKYVAIASGNDTLTNPLQTSPTGNLDLVTIKPDDPSHTVLQFNDLGRVSASSSENGAFSPLTSDASFAIAPATNSRGTRKLTVKVSPAGKVRMCDPDKTFSDTNPDGC